MFGWTLTESGGPATMIDTGGGSGINGHMSSLGHEPHHYATFYVQVDDIPAYLAKIESLGGKTIVPPVTIPTGTFAWFADPDGTTIGLWTPKAGRGTRPAQAEQGWSRRSNDNCGRARPTQPRPSCVVRTGRMSANLGRETRSALLTRTTGSQPGSLSRPGSKSATQINRLVIKHLLHCLFM